MAEDPKSFTCECGEEHKFALYVYAHWDMVLTHTCVCGRVHNIYKGKASLNESLSKKNGVKATKSR